MKTLSKKNKKSNKPKHRIIDLTKTHPSRKNKIIDKILKFVKKHPAVTIIILPP